MSQDPVEHHQARDILARVEELAAGAVEQSWVLFGDAAARIDPANLVTLMQRLRDDEALALDMLTDLTAVDHLGRSPRFEVVYHLYSTSRNHRLRLKLDVGEDPCQLDSVVEVWPAANWMEREVFDLYGIRFRKHPDLRRILLTEDFQGHPLRKDFPKAGADSVAELEKPRGA